MTACVRGHLSARAQCFPPDGDNMIGVFVTFKYGNEFSEASLRKIAEGARAKFENMPALLYKVFTVDAEARNATNLYVWESDEAAKAFFTDQLVERVTALYGVRPSVRYVQIPAIVENRKR
jgi:hypothetical protein